MRVSTKIPSEMSPTRSIMPQAVRWALVSLSVTMLMPSLDTSIANAGLPTLAKEFHASFPEVQWIVLSYLLAITSLIVSVGRLGDIVGRRRLLLMGIVIFTAASLLCGVAPTLWFLLAGRAAQGLGAAIMMALAVAFVGETVPKEKTGSAMGLLGTMSAIGTALGPSVGGLLISEWNWRTIFLINVPLGILNFLLAWRYLPSDQPQSKVDKRGFDLPGTLLLASSLAAYALAMTIDHNHFKTLHFVLLATAAWGVGLFIIAEKKASSPLIQLTMFQDRILRSSLIMSMLVTTVMMATLVVGPFYLSVALELKAAVAGFALSAGPLFAALAGVPSGRMVDRFGARKMTIVGLTGILAGSSMLAMTSPSLGIAGYVIPIIAMTSNYALFQAANNTVIMTGIRPEQRGVISGMLSLSRNLGLITGASVMGAVFTFASKTTDILTADPTAVAHGMRSTFIAAALIIVMALVIARPVETLSQRSSAQS